MKAEDLCVNAKRRASQMRRQEQSISEPSLDQQSVWSDRNQDHLAIYKGRSGPDQYLRRAYFGSKLRCRFFVAGAIIANAYLMNFFCLFLVSQQNWFKRSGSRFCRLNWRFSVLYAFFLFSSF